MIRPEEDLVHLENTETLTYIPRVVLFIVWHLRTLLDFFITVRNWNWSFRKAKLIKFPSFLWFLLKGILACLVCLETYASCLRHNQNLIPLYEIFRITELLFCLLQKAYNRSYSLSNTTSLPRLEAYCLHSA